MRKPRMSLSRKARDQIDGTLFIALPILGLFTFVGIPLVFSLVLSFGKLNSFNITDITFVGFQNYIDIFKTDPTYWEAVGWSFLYAVATSLLQTVLALLIAFLLSKIKYGQSGIRIILFIPYVCSVVAISYVWTMLLNYDFGVFNDILTKMGIPAIDFLKIEPYSIIMMVVMSVWSGLGYGTILYSAALGSVDKSLYESADVFGSNGVQKFFKITLPSISPTTFFLLVMGMIGNLQAFANFQIMRPIFADKEIKTMVYQVWWAAFGDGATEYGMGYASALGWVSGVVIILFTFIMFKLQKKWVHYES